jgi:hypothetical protein
MVEDPDPLIAIPLRILEFPPSQTNQHKQSPCSSVVIGDVGSPSLLML